MIVSFGNKVAFDLFHKGSCKKLSRSLWQRAIYLMDLLDAVETLDDLKAKGFPPSIRLHRLKGDRAEEFAIDIHKLSGWRITFIFFNGNFKEVKIEDYHK